MSADNEINKYLLSLSVGNWLEIYSANCESKWIENAHEGDLRGGAWEFSKEQTQLWPLAFIAPAKPLHTESKKTKQNCAYIADDRYVTIVKKQLSLTQPNIAHRRQPLQPRADRKRLPKNASRVMLNESHSGTSQCCWCSLSPAGSSTLTALTQSPVAHTQITGRVYSIHRCITRQIVTRVLYTLTLKQIFRIKWLTYCTRVPSADTTSLNMYGVCTLVLLLLPLYIAFGKFAITTNFLYCWILNSVDIRPTYGSHLSLTVCLKFIDFRCFFFFHFSFHLLPHRQHSVMDFAIASINWADFCR